MSSVTEMASVLVDTVNCVFLSLLRLLGSSKVSSSHCLKGYFSRLHLFLTQSSRTYLWGAVFQYMHNICCDQIGTISISLASDIYLVLEAFKSLCNSYFEILNSELLTSDFTVL